MNRQRQRCPGQGLIITSGIALSPQLPNVPTQAKQGLTRPPDAADRSDSQGPFPSVPVTSVPLMPEDMVDNLRLLSMLQLLTQDSRKR